MPDSINALIDPLRRYKVFYIGEIEVAARGYKHVWEFITDYLDHFERGTTIAKLDWHYMRCSHAFILHNPNWETVPIGEYLPEYKGSLPPRRLQAIEDTSVIDVDFCTEDPKALESKDNGKPTGT